MWYWLALRVSMRDSLRSRGKSSFESRIMREHWSQLQTPISLVVTCCKNTYNENVGPGTLSIDTHSKNNLLHIDHGIQNMIPMGPAPAWSPEVKRLDIPKWSCSHLDLLGWMACSFMEALTGKCWRKGWKKGAQRNPKMQCVLLCVIGR